MDETLSQLIEQEENAIQKYKSLLSAYSGATVSELIERILTHKKFELETLKLLKTGNIPDRFLSFGTIADEEVNFRESPSSQGSILDVLERGTPAILTEKRGNWVRIQLYDGQIGWVFKDYVRSGE